MSIVVEHDKRRKEILESALDIFAEDGFENVTYQKIADRCGITRTTLYIYFKNKRDIFNFSIKQLMQNFETDIAEIRSKKELSHAEKLLKVMIVIIERLEENRRLLSVVISFLYSVAKSGHDPNYGVRRRTVRLRHMISTMLIEGIRAGEFTESINIKDTDELLYSFLETAVLRLVILRLEKLDPLKDAVRMAVQNLERR